MSFRHRRKRSLRDCVVSQTSDVLVFLRCPTCRHEWHAATIKAGAYWGDGIKPSTIAKQCYCPKCEWPPPMEIANQETQLSLL